MKSLRRFTLGLSISLLPMMAFAQVADSDGIVDLPVPPGFQTAPPVVNHSDLSAKCIQLISDAGYDLNQGHRVSICQQVAGDTALEALEAYTSQGGTLSDSTLNNLISITESRGLSCVKNLIDAGYDVSQGSRINICRQVSSDSASVAIASLAAAGGVVTDSTLLNLSKIKSNLGATCAQSLISAGYDINSGLRSSYCAMMNYNTYGVSALSTVTEAGANITDSTQKSLLSVRTPSGLACVRILVGAGYDINYGQRAFLCTNFKDAGVSALQDMVDNGGYISDSTLAPLTHLQ